MKRLIAAALAIASSAVSAETLHLTCIGEGTANKLEQRHAYVGTSDGQSAWATSEEHRQVGFADQVDIEIDGDTGKIRMPRSMLPPAHGGKDGWMDIINLAVSDRSIDGSAAVNFINAPKLHIDRVTGLLSLAGRSGLFTAQCKSYDPATVQRAF